MNLDCYTQGVAKSIARERKRQQVNYNRSKPLSIRKHYEREEQRLAAKARHAARQAERRLKQQLADNVPNAATVKRSSAKNADWRLNDLNNVRI